MNELDQQIRDALQSEPAATADDEDLDYEGVMDMFRGRRRWLTVCWAVCMAVTVTMIVVSAVQFFRVESVRAMIGWAAGFVVCVILEALIELSFLAECRKNTIQCQVKRLELQVASLAARLPTEKDR